MSAPEVTVLMTVYNASAYLRSAIESILKQTFSNFEFLIIDDGSTDNSVEIVRSYNDARIRLVANPANTGQTACLNQGLTMAQGALIARQDADDLSDPARLEKQAEAFRADVSLALAGCQGWIIDKESRRTGVMYLPLTHEEIAWSRFFENPFLHAGVMFKRAIIGEEFGGYDPVYRICQDYELWTRVVRKHKTCNLRERLVQYRVYGESLSKSGIDTVRDEVRRVVERELHETFEHLLQGEVEIVSQFRFGLDPERMDTFSECYRHLLSKYRGMHPKENLSRAIALHEMKLAYDALPTMKSVALKRLFNMIKESPALFLEVVQSNLQRRFARS